MQFLGNTLALKFLGHNDLAAEGPVFLAIICKNEHLPRPGLVCIVVRHVFEIDALLFQELDHRILTLRECLVFAAILRDIGNGQTRRDRGVDLAQRSWSQAVSPNSVAGVFAAANHRFPIRYSLANPGRSRPCQKDLQNRNPRYNPDEVAGATWSPHVASAP